MPRYFVDKESGEIYGGLDENGHEIPDPRPMAIPSGLGRPETLEEQVRRLVRSNAFTEPGQETFEEAEDFDVDDDFDPSTPYELQFDPVLGKEVSPQMILENRDRYDKEVMEMVKTPLEEHIARQEAEEAKAAKKPSRAKKTAKTADPEPEEEA